MCQNQTTSKDNSNITNTGIPNESEVNEPSEDAIVEKQILPKNGNNKSTQNSTYGTNKTESRQAVEEKPTNRK